MKRIALVLATIIIALLTIGGRTITTADVIMFATHKG